MFGQDWPPSSSPESAPEALRALWPLVLHYGISDDQVREDTLEAASDAELTELVRRVDKPVLQAINQYLDLVHDAEEAVPFGDLAQAAMEAQLLLKQRH